MDRYFHDEMPVPGLESLVRNAATTFHFRVRGNAMAESSIRDGDVLVVDRSVAPINGHIVVAFVAGERIVRRLGVRDGVISLVADEQSARIVLETLEQYTAETEDPRICGVVVGVFKRIRS